MPAITSSDVATSLPNVPTTRRQAVADACNGAAIGQSYAGSDVLATLATFGWWYPLTETTAAFSDAAGTVACANGDGIQVQKSWITQNDLSQSSSASRPIFNSATGTAFTKATNTSLEISDPLITGTTFSILVAASVSNATSGLFAMTGSSNGFGLGVGGTTTDNNGNNLIGLREIIAFVSTGYAIGADYKVLAYKTNNVSGTYYDNGSQSALYSTGQNINAPTSVFSIGGRTGSRCIDGIIFSVLIGVINPTDAQIAQASRFLSVFHGILNEATYNGGTDTVAITGTELSPCPLDKIVAAVANTSKASKTGGYTYNFSFAVLNGGNGFVRFDPDTFTTFADTRFEKNGSTGGMIFRERSVVRQEGSAYVLDSGNAGAYTGYKIIAYRDIEGSNPRLIQAGTNRYDILSANASPVINTPTFVITGLDVETIGSNVSSDVSASLKIYTSVSSSISNLRILSRDTRGCEFQAQSGLFSDLALENAAISTSPTAAQTITFVRPVFNFKGVTSSLSFNFNNTATVEIQDPIFPNGAWNGNYTGVITGFRSNVSCLVNISYSSKLIFLNGSIPRQLKVRHARNDGANIDLVANGIGVASQLLLTSIRNGSGFGLGTVGASANYTWTITARKYDYAVAADTDILYSAQSFLASSSLFVQVSLVPFLFLSESAAAALTGIFLAASGSTSGLATISIARTSSEIWQYYRQFIATYSNFGSIDSWIYDGATLDLGAWNITITAALTGKIKCAGTITLGAGGSVTSATTAATTIVIVQPGNTDLRTWTFTSGTVINVSSSTAIVTVAVDQLANVTAGTGVTIQAPAASISALSFAQNTRVQVARLEPYSVPSTAINTATNIITIAGNRFKSASPATLVYFQLGSGATIPTTTPQITNNTLYFVQSAGLADSLAAGQFKLSLTQSGTAIAFSTQGTGNFTLTGITELDNSLAGASGYSAALTEPSGTLLRVSAQPWQNAIGCTAGTFYQQSIIWNSTDGNAIADTVSISANPDIIHNFLIGNSTRVFNTNVTLPSDGSTVSGISFNAQGVISLDPRSFASVAGFPTLTPQAAYLYTVFYRSTAAGIRFIGNQFSAQDSANFALSGLKLDNIADGIRNTPNTPAMIAGGYIGTTDGSNPILPISGAIYLNADRRGVLVTTTAGSTISPTQQQLRDAQALSLSAGATVATGSIDSKLDNASSDFVIL